MGVGRYVRLDDADGVAEVAVTVVDGYQGRGLGTLLVAVLARSAKRNGIHTLRGYVLAQNHQMLRIFDHLETRRVLEGDGTYRVDLSLPDDPDQLPDTPPARVFKAVVRGELDT